MDEDSLTQSLTMYKSQLEQVESALAMTGIETNSDLVQLKKDLLQVIELTEGSLLSMKKSKLLAMVDTSTEKGSGSQPTKYDHPQATSEMDAEFAAFQAAIAADKKDGLSLASTSATPSGASSSIGGAQNLPEVEEGTCSDMADVVGSKCRAPFSHDWGESGYFNAMIIGMEAIDEESDPRVRIVFTHPTHQAMLPCPFFLDDRCKFDDESCRYSHGHLVNVCDLKEFHEPDFSLLGIDTKCLAKNNKSLWQEGTVVDILDNHQFQVMFDPCNIIIVDIEDIVPKSEFFDGHLSDSLSDSDNEELDLRVIRSDDEDSDDELPVYLWRPNQTTDKLAAWEVHTKGIGSKLMMNMGYIMGQGLGRNCEGRAEPVPIQLLPQGKSLDRIMELKELAGDRDVFDVLKKDKGKAKKTGEKAKAQPKKKAPSVFEFLNKKIHVNKHKGDVKSLNRHSGGGKFKSATVKHISMKDLKEKSDKNINIQLFQTHEEISKVQKEISRLKLSLARQVKSDPVAAGQIQQKISSMEKYLDQLRNSENSIQKHKKARSDHKKLTIF